MLFHIKKIFCYKTTKETKDSHIFPFISIFQMITLHIDEKKTLLLIMQRSSLCWCYSLKL